ncbi:hypothetical protein M2277_005627 [Paenibacillus sp. LBL]|nr:hypothetical protein [Paenibacillus sp. LBL]
MSRCDRCKKEIINMTTTNERSFVGGTLVVTDVPVQKCDCEEQILLADAALMAGYARMLVAGNIIGKVTVSLSDLQRRFSVEDFQRTTLSPS